MLKCRDLSVRYGPHLALSGVSLLVNPGEIVVILGANGAGKSTMLRRIAGLIDIDEEDEDEWGGANEVYFNDALISDWDPHEIVEAGLSMVPEGRALFGELSVLENLKLGAYTQRARAAENENLEKVFTVFPKLAERRKQMARTMSGGEQQMVAVGRALMSAPLILMLDEPSLGLSPILCTELFNALVEIRNSGIGIFLVEQNAKQSLTIADRGYLLEVGRITGEDTASALTQDAAVQRAYLGGGLGFEKNTAGRRRTTHDILGGDVGDLVRGAESRLKEYIDKTRRSRNE